MLGKVVEGVLEDLDLIVGFMLLVLGMGVRLGEREVGLMVVLGDLGSISLLDSLVLFL